LGVTVLLLGSCGLRVEPTLRAQGIRGATAGNGGSQGVGGTTSPGGTAVPGQAATTGPANGTAVTGPTTGPHAGGGQSTGTTGALPAPPGGNGGATDIGVTANSITVGSVTTLSGPVPGLFAGAVKGARAYFAYQNSLGGIYGRQLNLSVADDQLDCGQNRAQHLSQVPHVLGFVSSLSLYDNCGAEVLQTNKTVPDVALAFSTKAGGLANNFSIAPLVPGYRLGSFEYYKQKYPGAIGHMATLVGNIGSAVEIWKGIKAAALSLGYNVAYERSYSPGETDFTADVIQMRQKGVQMLYFVSADAHTIARVANTAAQQNWHPQLFAVGAGNATYDPGFIHEAGAAAEGMVADQAQALFFNAEDASNIPGVARYQEWMNKIGQGGGTDLYSAWGWGSAMLAVQGMKAAGPHLTRATWLAAMKSIHRFDGDGMFAASDPASKKPATCYVVLKVVHGKFTRVDTPAKSFRCDAGYYYYKP
jgi:ABC-type branched-subunit amino acid transport system substrate-binding protein